MMRTLVSLICLLLLTPIALADDHGGAGPDEHVRVLAVLDLGDETYYVAEDHGSLQLWKESNGLATDGVPRQPGNVPTGLQTAWSCVEEGRLLQYVHAHEDCASGEKTPPDTRVTNGMLVGLVDELVHEILHEAEHLLL